MSEAIELMDVCVRRGERPVLAGVSFRIERGERVAILGENGIGKSTLLDVILGLSTPAAGRAVLPVATRAGRVGLVSQDPSASLLPWLSSGANVELPLRIAGLGNAERAAALSVVRERFDPGLRVPLDRSPSAISGGERQIVALMRAFVGSPELVVADEPLSAIDVVARLRLRDAMLASCRAHGTTLVLVTHELDDIAVLATRALLLAGRPARVRADVALTHGDVRALERALRAAAAEGNDDPAEMLVEPRLAGACT